MTSAARPRLFVHTNHRQHFAARVAAHSFSRMSAHADRFDVEFLALDDFPHLKKRHGEEYLRSGRPAVWNNDDLQSFTPLRFAVPQVMGFEGRAIVVDPDVFAASDVWELFERPPDGKPVQCRLIEPGGDHRPYWATSVMLLDCAGLRHWEWDAAIDEMFAFERDYRAWMSLHLEAPENVGRLEDVWNHYDTLTAETRLLHNTGRVTQPWKTGLPIEFTRDKPLPEGRKWGIVPKRWVVQLRELLRPEPTHYAAHADPDQEQLFFAFLDDALVAGVVTEEELEEEMRRLHIRTDAVAELEERRRAGGGRVAFPDVVKASLERASPEAA